MSAVLTDPITGATSITGSLTVDNINIRGISLGSTTLSSNAIWLPSTSLQWTPVVAPDLPTFNIPDGGTMTYSRRNGVYRWIGNDVSYNINVAGLLNTQSTVTTGDYTLNVPYPININAYGANALIGELWLTTYYLNTSNAFKAYARTIAADASNVTIRVLAGTADDTLTTASSNTTMILQGTMTYNTSSFNQVGGVPAAYLPAAFYQNAAGQVLLNSNVVGAFAPRGQLDIVYNSNLPALVVDQLSTGDVMQVKTGGTTQLVVNADGNVGIGTTNPVVKLQVFGGYLYAEPPIAIIEDQKAVGTQGGGSAATTWNIRTLNTFVTNTIGVTLSSSVFTIPAGRYHIVATTPAYNLGRHRCRLYNTTAASATAYGTSCYIVVGSGVQTDSILDFVFTVAASTSFRIEHWTAGLQAGNGLGVETNATGVEIYTRVKLIKYA